MSPIAAGIPGRPASVKIWHAAFQAIPIGVDGCGRSLVPTAQLAWQPGGPRGNEEQGADHDIRIRHADRGGTPRACARCGLKAAGRPFPEPRVKVCKQPARFGVDCIGPKRQALPKTGIRVLPEREGGGVSAFAVFGYSIAIRGRCE